MGAAPVIDPNRPELLSSRWTPMVPHVIQHAAWVSRARFKVLTAGRRSGKTELAKRAAAYFAIFTQRIGARIICCNPTRPQAKAIFWEDMKKLIPACLIEKISETELTITLSHNGARIEVHGMDSPERIEGSPIDFIVIDEVANIKPHAWDAHVRPGLSTLGRPGFAWLVGVPEGRNHLWKLWKKAIDPNNRAWEGFTWKSSDILPKWEVAEARSTMDPQLFAQEFEGAFNTATGLVYYTFERSQHAVRKLKIDPDLPLILGLDFNVAPGTATIMQEQAFSIEGFKPTCTAICDEVWIPKDSNTERVSRAIIDKYGDHPSKVIVYGDPAGGARKTSARATDWDIVEEIVGGHFRDRGISYEKRVRTADPGHRSRINSLNSRLRSADGKRGMLIDPRCKHLIDDFEGVVYLEGTNEPDKKADLELTHLSDGVAYFTEYEYRQAFEKAVSGSL